VAIPNIRAFNAEARFIAMFRNPVELVHSLHSQLLYWSEESVTDFEAAWRLQDRRREGVDLPPGSRGGFLLQYEEMARLGSQVERLLSAVPAQQVKLILYDEFAASPRRVYDEVIAFLNLPHDGRAEFPRINDNKHWLSDVLGGAAVGITSAMIMDGKWTLFGAGQPHFLATPKSVSASMSIAF